MSLGGPARPAVAAVVFAVTGIVGLGTDRRRHLPAAPPGLDSLLRPLTRLARVTDPDAHECDRIPTWGVTAAVWLLVGGAADGRRLLAATVSVDALCPAGAPGHVVG